MDRREHRAGRERVGRGGARVVAGVRAADGFRASSRTDRTDLLQIDGGRLVGVRRFRAGGGDAAMIVDAIGPSARVGVIGVTGKRRELGAALAVARRHADALDRRMVARRRAPRAARRAFRRQ